MFGYDPCKVYRGRGAFETIGARLPLPVGDVAFKCNLATMADNGSGVVRLRCAGTGFADVAKVLCRDLNGISLPSFPDVDVAVQRTGNHRVAVSFRGPGLPDCISNTDPLSDDLPLLKSVPTADTKEARRKAAIANEVSDRFREVLREHPITQKRRAHGKSYADVVLLRGASEQIFLRPFKDFNKIAMFMIAPTKISAGIGHTAHIDIVFAPGAAGGYSTNLNSKAAACVKLMSQKSSSLENAYAYDMGIIHIKAVDEAAHDRDVTKKGNGLKRLTQWWQAFTTFVRGRAREDDPRSHGRPELGKN